MYTQCSNPDGRRQYIIFAGELPGEVQITQLVSPSLVDACIYMALGDQLCQVSIPTCSPVRITLQTESANLLGDQSHHRWGPSLRAGPG